VNPWPYHYYGEPPVLDLDLEADRAEAAVFEPLFISIPGFGPACFLSGGHPRPGCNREMPFPGSCGTRCGLAGGPVKGIAGKKRLHLLEALNFGLDLCEDLPGFHAVSLP